MLDSEIHKEMENIYQNMNGSFAVYNFTYIIRNGKVEVDGDIMLTPSVTSIPVPFRSVSGNFYINKSTMLSLHNAPQEVGKGFYCSGSSIQNLRGGPIEVGESFWCSQSKITSLRGAPTEVGGSFDCSTTAITSLEGAPRHIGGSLYTNETNLTSLEGAPRHIGKNLWCLDNFTEAPDHSHIDIGSHIIWQSAMEHMTHEERDQYLRNDRELARSVREQKFTEFEGGLYQNG